MLPDRPDPLAPDRALVELEQALRRVTFVPPSSTWQRVRQAVPHAPAPHRVIGIAGAILLCLLILATLVYLFNLVLGDLLT